MSRSLRTDPELYELTKTNSNSHYCRSEVRSHQNHKNEITNTTNNDISRKQQTYRTNDIDKTWTIAIAASVSEEYSLDLYHAEQHEPSQFTREYTQLYSTG